MSINFAVSNSKMYLDVIHSPPGSLKFSGKDIPMVAPSKQFVTSAAHLCINETGVQGTGPEGWIWK